MRKLETQKDKDRKKKRNQLIVGLILIFVMLGSTVGYAFSSFTKSSDSEKSELKYNNYEFVKQNSFWMLTIGNFNFAFKYNPKEIENLSLNIENLSYVNSYNGKPLYVYSENSEAKLEIYQNFQNIVERMQSACYEKSKCQEDWPLKDCTNNFVIIQEGSSNKIEQKQNCVFIEGKKEDLTKLTDEFLYKIIGVKQ
jgi:hypothetical protein